MAARKTSASPTRIWTFPARVADESLVFGALRTANRYYNELVAIERRRHERYRDIRRTHAPELADCEDHIAMLNDAIEAVYHATKRDRADHYRATGEKARLVGDAQANVFALRAEMNDTNAKAKALRAAFAKKIEPAREAFKARATERAAGGGPRTKSAANAAVLDEMLGEPLWHTAWKEIARSDAQAHRETLAARAACGLSTGTYLVTEEAFQRAKVDSMPRPPKFRAFKGGGKLAVQLRDATWGDLSKGEVTALTVAQAPDVGKRGDQSRMRLVHLDQSIPRGERREVAMTVKMHRMPPDGAAVKWAALMVRRIGARHTFELQLTIEDPSFAEVKRPSGTRAPEHVRIGWSRVGTGVLVARWPGGAVVVPGDILSQNEHAASIESVADRLYDRAKKLAQRWTARGPHELTGWHRLQSDRARAGFRSVCEAYAAWAFADAHKWLWREWVKARKAEGLDLYATSAELRPWLVARGVQDQTQHAAFALYVWARKDAHLQQYAVDSRRRFVNRRDAFFRAEAIRIATEFASVTCDKYAISDVKELPDLTMPGEGERDQAQHQAQAAAPGRFREILREVMGARCELCERVGDDVVVPKKKRAKKKVAAEGAAS